MTREEQKKQIEDNLNRLRALRDQIRLDVHLAGMEAKERWDKLEPRFEDAQQLAKQINEVSRKAIAEIVDRFEAFRDSLKRHETHKHPLV